MQKFPFDLPLLLDGGTGSELIKLGMPPGVSTEKWVCENPDSILDIQRRYIAAGSDAVLSPTFHCNSHSLGDYDLSDMADEYNLRLGELSKTAAGDGALVLGDMSPPAVLLKPLGSYDFEYIYEVYARQTRALERAGVDGYIIETAMTLSEIRAIALAVRDNTPPDKPLFVTVTVGENGRTALSGADVLPALITLQAMGATAFGMNCSVGPGQMLKQIRRIAPYARVPLIAKPNAGMPTLIGGRTVYNCPPEEFAQYTRAMAESGVRIFGGCCGTAPEHIAALRAELDKIDFSALPELEKVDCPVMLADEKNAYFYDPGTKITLIPCDEDMGENSQELDGIAKITVSSPEELSDFAENSYTLSCGLCIDASDEELLEKALRLYQGRACCQGEKSGIPREFLEKMRDKYGLLLL
ncbi:MAG: homocysteine S-methyltransferase family protein [Oscillospiraceae bacterium]|nr:homocysteine S-methyltransferase family protein [Oscillospiraceae bacterium]